jgi:hypothetical protein
MTEAQAAWLRKLRDEEPIGAFNLMLWVACYGAGWIGYAHPDSGRSAITPAGLAALAAYEEKAK